MGGWKEGVDVLSHIVKLFFSRLTIFTHGRRRTDGTDVETEVWMGS